MWFHTFWRSKFQTKHENCVFEGPYFLQDYVFLVLHVFTALASQCKIPISSCRFADGWAGHRDSPSWVTAAAARPGWGHCTSCQPPPHSSHKQLTLFLLFVDPTTAASNWSAWWVRKQWGSPSVLAAHTQQPSFRNTDSCCGCIKEIPHKHLISQEYYLKTKSLRIGLNCREQCLLQMCLHLPEYTGTQSPLKSVGHRC